MLDFSNKLEKSIMLLTLGKIGLCGQKSEKRKEKWINFLLLLTFATMILH